MRNLVILVFLCVNLTISGATYYVSPSGSDSNPGTIGQPFFTLNKAWNYVSAGDIIYMRGGTYNYTTTQSLTSKDGTSGNLISISAYPGEHPIIDYNGATSPYIALYLKNADYLYLKGIRITGLSQSPSATSGYYGMILWADVNHCTFELLETDHIGGWGVVIGDNSSNNLFLNCDSHHNSDPNTIDGGDPWGGSDGFEAGSHGSNTSTNIIFRGCRAWANSDDGWDLRQADGVYTLDNCWSFWNGYQPSTVGSSWATAGNGDGYKLGGKTSPGTNSILRTIKNSLSFGNRMAGITPEPDDVNEILGVEISNCVAYQNGDYGIGNGNYSNYALVRNCIVYKNNEDARIQTGMVHDHNSFDISGAVSDADFMSVNSSGVDGPRQADGSLPNVSFLHLSAGSHLIDAGVNVGIPYNGVNPDLGAFEVQTGSTITVPVYTSGAVQNATPSLLEMTYNMTLANIVPSISSFIVLVNSVARTVNLVSVSGAKVKLTLANRIVAGDVVTVSYTKPASTPIQTTSNGTAASISNQQVNNNCINSAPTAIITSPLTNSSFSTSTNITVTASALDTDGSVTMVEFYNGSTKLGSKSSAPYTLTLNNVTAGNYSLTVTATDNLNAKTTSSSILISVVDDAHKPNQHPIVKILNPSKGIKFDKLSPVTIDAIASDPDGSVSKIEFYNGSVKLVELTSSPYTYTWKDVAAGKYLITAVATDNLNDTTISSPVEFEVGSTVKYDMNSEIVKLYPNPNNGHFSIEFINPLQNEKGEIIITDLAGKQVYNGPVSKEETLKQIDVSDSRSGIYVMMIMDKDILVTKKFIKN
jgi:uncharacterized repeat protein (TIGR02059 family)